jgi:hypothetical protein
MFGFGLELDSVDYLLNIPASAGALMDLTRAQCMAFDIRSQGRDRIHALPKSLRTSEHRTLL